VDEVWVGSEHVRRAIAAVTDKRVERLPVPVVAPQPSWRDRASFAIGPGYAFVFTFDFLSVIERKNPQAVIAAYRTAFGPDDGATLVLKSVNGHQRVDELEALRAAAAGRPDIVVLDEYLTRADQAALLAACDCYVSLHRAEGFGLGMAEAMALGKPVIATGYSGNVDFMNAANSILVGYDRVAVPPGLAIYPAGSEWADPDVEEAAAAMARLAHDPALGARLGARAKDDLGTHWDAATCGRRMHARLHDFWRTDAPVSGP
jgi:glycosyltransferase involved in cell wall biosynthesis